MAAFQETHYVCYYCRYALPMRNFDFKQHTCFKDWDPTSQDLMTADDGCLVMTCRINDQNVIVNPRGLKPPEPHANGAKLDDNNVEKGNDGNGNCSKGNNSEKANKNSEDKDCDEQDSGKNKQLNIWSDCDEELIDAVFDEPPLWNSGLSVKERSPKLRTSSWNRVRLTLNEKRKFSVVEIKKRWRHLRSCYMKEKKKRDPTNKKSGSKGTDQPGKKTGFRFYERMQFLSDHVKEVSSTCNADDDTDSDEEEEDENKSPNKQSPSHSGRNNHDDDDEKPYTYKKRRRSEEPMKEKLLQTLLQRPKPPDRIDGVLIQWGSVLRRLPDRPARDLEWKMHNLIHEFETKWFDQEESGSK